MKWYFYSLRPGDTTRDPIVGEFFSTEAISNTSQAVVREGIQNALDAGKMKPVRVRIFLALGKHALDAGQVGYWLEGAWEHLHALGNGLREPPDDSADCPFLVFEDFGTTGLQGDETQSFDEPNTKNNFCYFFRAEGRSGKGEQDRGRWGVGKQVFPRSGQISTFFGLTIRDDDGKRLLMGRTILKSHRLNTTHYSPDGYFGEQRQDNLVLPISDAAVLDRFCNDFRLTRKVEPGLSIVVPLVDPDITIEKLKEAVVSDYFYPILTGTLAVSIESPDGMIEINSQTLVNVALDFDGDISDRLLPVVDLAEWATSRSEQDVLNLKPCGVDRPAWSDDLIPTEFVTSMRDKLDKGDKLAVRASLTVREKGGPSRPSYFHIYFWQDGYESGRPVFIRDGIIISDIHAPRARGVRSLVVIEDKPLATLLGDSENPAHTQWQKDSSNFKGKYVYGPSYIEFVTKSASSIVHALRAQEEQEDKSLLLDIFSLPSEEPETALKRLSEKPEPMLGNTSDEDGPNVEPRKKRFRILRSPGGFTVTRGDKETVPPAWLDIMCAYDIRNGNPLRKYDIALKSQAADFRLGRDGVEITEKAGVEIAEQENNHIRVEILNPEFRLTVAGFDENRDLFVSVRMQESDND